MKIVIFHPTHLPPKDYGGIERVVLWLAQGLIELGHEVSIAAFKSSELPPGVKLIEIDPNDSGDLEFIRKIPSGTDVVHFMAPPQSETWDRLPCAGLVTIHGNGKAGEIFHRNSIFLSRDHAQRHGGKIFVYNGIDPNEVQFRNEKSDHYLFLSKTSWSVKNLSGAMRMCRRARVPLRIAGGHRPFYLKLIAKFNSQMNWLGPVSGIEKAKNLAEARALVFPVKWPEPFGLVIVEALMAGTPVIASSLGSIPELVSPQVGAVIDLMDEKKWLEVLSMEHLPWNSEDCRKRAIELFHYSVMSKNYVAQYQKVISGQTLHTENPVGKGWSKI